VGQVFEGLWVLRLFLQIVARPVLWLAHSAMLKDGFWMAFLVPAGFLAMLVHNHATVVSPCHLPFHGEASTGQVLIL